MCRAEEAMHCSPFFVTYVCNISLQVQQISEKYLAWRIVFLPLYHLSHFCPIFLIGGLTCFLPSSCLDCDWRMSVETGQDGPCEKLISFRHYPSFFTSLFGVSTWNWAAIWWWGKGVISCPHFVLFRRFLVSISGGNLAVCLSSWLLSVMIQVLSCSAMRYTVRETISNNTFRAFLLDSLRC